MVSVALIALLLPVVATVHVQEPVDERLYARATTTDGRVVEGYLRWDRNEAVGGDFLDGAREIPRAVLREAERLDPEYGEEMRRERSLVAFGVRITWAEDDLADPPLASSSVRMARVAEIVPLEERKAAVILHGGASVELVGTTTDIGPSVREIVLEAPGRSPVSLDWQDLERLELLPVPEGVSAPAEERLLGTLRTREGVEATGWVSWDLEEAFPSDLLDGRADGTERSIAFGDIRSIARIDARSARVRLRSGEEVVLRGSNDVDHRNRGIEISDVGLGRVRVPWGALSELTLHVDPEGAATTRGAVGRDEPAGSPQDPTENRPIRGTVFARDGRVVSGLLRWGHEEEGTWELLDGLLDDAEVGVEFGAVSEVRPDGPDAAVVRLRSGHTLRLHGTDDVGPGHRGVFVTAEGRTTRLVRWRDVQRVVIEP